MSWSRSTRRRVLQGIGVGGTAALLGSGSTVAHGDSDEANDDDDIEEDEEDEPADTEDEFAAIRCGHLSPDTPDVDVYLGKPPDLNPTIRDLSYPTFGPGPMDAYLEVPPGSYSVAVAPAGTTEPAIDVEAVELDAGFRYTALAIGELGAATENDEPADRGLQPLVIVDAESTEDATPPAVQAEVSFVHASPDAPDVDIEVDGDPLLEGVGFGDASDYFAVDPGDYEISIVANGEAVLSETRTLQAGTSITAYVTGFAGAPEAEDEEETEETEDDVDDTEEADMEDDEDEMDENDEETQALEALRVVISLDGTNPLADNVLIR